MILQEDGEHPRTGDIHMARRMERKSKPQIFRPCKALSSSFIKTFVALLVFAPVPEK